jgi:ABC-type lipoprotein release transport system permease subunit
MNKPKLEDQAEPIRVPHVRSAENENVSATVTSGFGLFGLKATDSLTFTGAAIVLSFAALLASWAPARRASRIQPIQALRHE